MKNVCVLGLGYIGLPTAAILASRGYKVTGVDVSQEVVNSISRGEVHIVEPDLDMLVRSGINSGNFRVSLEPDDSDVYIICVPTPFKDSEGTPVPDISYVECCAKQLAGYVEKGDMVILESTSPPGTTEKVAELLSASGLKVGEDIFVAHAPERVLPGNILREVVENDRIVGGVDLKSARKVKEFYEGFVKGEVVATDSRTAELCKLVENSYRDVNIAFANEIANVSELFGINVWDLIKFANRHPRVNILKPGPGVGGHCIAVDPWFIIDVAKQETPLLQAARSVNESRPDRVVTKIMRQVDKMKNPVVGCLGVTYKPDIDDVRESPAMDIVRKLIKKLPEESLVVHDPYFDGSEKGLETDSLENLIENSDIVVLLVHHKQYLKLDKKLFEEKILIDTRGIFD